MAVLDTVGLFFFLPNLMSETFFIYIFLITGEIEHLFIGFTGYLHFKFCDLFVLIGYFSQGFFFFQYSTIGVFVFFLVHLLSFLAILPFW